MDFSETIKNIRKEHQLTQEQMATKLFVSRQAISNWENNRNLPDLEMLILIAEEFNLSLDTLILGGKQMSEKLIQDTSENRRAKINLISILIGVTLLLLGVLLLFIKANSVEYIDTNGILHENFFLIPIAFILIISSLIVFMSIGIRSFIYYLKNKRHKIS